MVTLNSKDIKIKEILKGENNLVKTDHSKNDIPINQVNVNQLYLDSRNKNNKSVESEIDKYELWEII